MLASGEDRAAMLRLAVSDIPKAEVCTLELEAEGRSYTYLTLRKLRALYPDDRFTLIIGGDMLRTFKEWRNWEEILGNASLLAAARDDGEYERLLRTAADFPGARVLKVPPLPMSSTGVREAAAAGKPLTGMVPPGSGRLHQNPPPLRGQKGWLKPCGTRKTSPGTNTTPSSGRCSSLPAINTPAA